MKNYLYILSLFLNIVLIILLFLFHNSSKVVDECNDVYSSMTSQNNLTSNDVAFDIIFGKIDSNFNLLLTTITVLFGLFALLTFFGVKEQFKFQLSSMKNEIKRLKSDWAEHKLDILDLRADLSYEIADKISTDISVIKNKEGETDEDLVKIVELTLVCCDYYSQCLISKKEIYPKFKDSVTFIIKGKLGEAAKLVSNESNIELKDLGYERFLRLQENIHKVADIEDKQNLASIFSKLSFASLS